VDEFEAISAWVESDFLTPLSYEAKIAPLSGFCTGCGTINVACQSATAA